MRHDGAHKGPGIARIEWLDGVRALAAIYVMLHHIYLHVFPGFPESPGPFGLGWLMYGQLAVVVFIVVSGFSLGLAPARGGNRLKDGASGFFQRRAWRILPPYWVALLFSLAVAHFLLVEAPGREVNVRSLVVHGLLHTRHHPEQHAEFRVLVDRRRGADLLVLPAHVDAHARAVAGRNGFVCARDRLGRPPARPERGRPEPARPSQSSALRVLSLSAFGRWKRRRRRAPDFADGRSPGSRAPSWLG